MGDDMVGIVHPCKIYGAMACGRPVLLVGPHSHAGELIDRHEIGWQFEHGDASGIVSLIEHILATGTSRLTEMGLRAQAAIDRALSKSCALRRLVRRNRAGHGTWPVLRPARQGHSRAPAVRRTGKGNGGSY